jgi:hypothetical protein
MEKEAEPQSAKFFHHCPNKKDALQIDFAYFHEFLTELPEKLERDQDENIIHSISVPKNEDSGMPSYNDFAAYYNDEYYWISFFNGRNCENLQLLDLLLVGFSLGKQDEGKFVEPTFMTTTESAFIKTYSFCLALVSNSETTYCHHFYLDRSKAGKDSSIVFRKANEIRRESMYKFFTSTRLGSDNSPMVRNVSSPITVPSSMTLPLSDNALSFEYSRPNKTLPRKEISYHSRMLRKLSNPPKKKSNTETEKSPRSPKGVISPKNSEGSKTGSSQESPKSPKGNTLSSESLSIKNSKGLEGGTKDEKNG